MDLQRWIKKLIANEVKCALCLARVPRDTTTEIFEREICDWCVKYYSDLFPKDWREKIKMLLFF